VVVCFARLQKVAAKANMSAPFSGALSHSNDRWEPVQTYHPKKA